MEQRRAERIEAERLDDLLKRFNVYNGLDEAIPARTLDASSQGLGLAAEVTEDMLSVGLVLFLESQANPLFKLAARVIYIKPMKNTFYKLGLQLVNTHSSEKYLEILNSSS